MSLKILHKTKFDMYQVLLFCFLFVGKTTFSLPANAYIGKDGTVGASWGGYSASAGLGGILGGNGATGGLHAQAGTPNGHFASAGLSGSTDGSRPSYGYASAQNVNGAALGSQNPQKTTFDDIFNIPISTLGAVNQYLNNRRKVIATRSPELESASGSSEASGTANAENQQLYLKSHKNYDDIFNIPISVLGSVNRFLNGR